MTNWNCAMTQHDELKLYHHARWLIATVTWLKMTDWKCDMSQKDWLSGTCCNSSAISLTDLICSVTMSSSEIPWLEMTDWVELIADRVSSAEKASWEREFDPVYTRCLFGGGSTPYTPFCSICTISSETMVFWFLLIWVSRGWHLLVFGGIPRSVSCGYLTNLILSIYNELKWNPWLMTTAWNRDVMTAWNRDVIHSRL